MSRNQQEIGWRACSNPWRWCWTADGESFKFRGISITKNLSWSIHILAMNKKNTPILPQKTTEIWLFFTYSCQFSQMHYGKHPIRNITVCQLLWSRLQEIAKLGMPHMNCLSHALSPINSIYTSLSLESSQGPITLWAYSWLPSPMLKNLFRSVCSQDKCL